MFPLQGDRLALVVGALGEPGLVSTVMPPIWIRWQLWVTRVMTSGSVMAVSLISQTVANEKGELSGRPRKRGRLRPAECAAGRWPGG